MARCQKFRIDEPLIDLYISSMENQHRLYSKRYLNALSNAFELETYYENDELAGVVVFDKQPNCILIIEVFFKSISKTGLIKTLLKACKGFNKIMFKTDIENKDVVEFGMRLTNQYEVIGESIFFEKTRGAVKC